MKSRARIIREARALLSEIEQIFVDAQHWNRINPHEPPINPDPDGQLARLAESLSHMLINDTGHGRIASIEP